VIEREIAQLRRLTLRVLRDGDVIEAGERAVAAA
jgi:hypothetical protein